MVFVYVVLLFTSLMIMFYLYMSYPFQFFWHRNRIKKSFIKQVLKKVNGNYRPIAYYAHSHKIINNSEYSSSSNRHKVYFSQCYNVIQFSTSDIDWEIYFHLIRDGVTFTEVFNLRAFPHTDKIKSEGNVEKSYNRVNIFTNNTYLTKMLENHAINDLETLMRYNGDILLITHNNLHFKAFLNARNISLKRVLELINVIHRVKTQVYKKDVIEY